MGDKENINHEEVELSTKNTTYDCFLQQWAPLNEFSKNTRSLLIQYSSTSRMAISLRKVIRTMLAASKKNQKAYTFNNANLPTISFKVYPDGSMGVFENGWLVGERKTLLNDPNINPIIACCNIQESEEGYQVPTQCHVHLRGSDYPHRIIDCSVVQDPVYPKLLESGRSLWCIGESDCLGEIMIGYQDGEWHAFVKGERRFSHPDIEVVKSENDPIRIDDEIYAHVEMVFAQQADAEKEYDDCEDRYY